MTSVGTAGAFIPDVVPEPVILLTVVGGLLRPEVVAVTADGPEIRVVF